MDSDDMLLLNKIYKSVLLTGRKHYSQASKDTTIKSACFLESFSLYLNEMNDKLSMILNLTDKYATECLGKATEIRKEIELHDTYTNDDVGSMHMFTAHQEKYKGMSWADMSEKEDKTENTIKKVKEIAQKTYKKIDYEHNLITYKTIDSINNVGIGFPYKIPIINKLSDIPSAFYWFNGDDKHDEGIYTSMSNGFYIKVPFPNIIDTTTSYNRTCSIKCKYNTYKDCLKTRKELSSKYKTDIRECNFAHKNDKYIKMGTAFRCPSMPHFGSHASLPRDLDTIPISDVKTMLMYSLSDMLISSVWFQKLQITKNKRENLKYTPKNQTNVVLTNIDIC
jgi:hypothetical protein